MRLIRVIAANGRSFIVMTSLMDDQAYPAAAFGDIYHARWRIEEAFKRLKHRLNLEHTSGLSWLSACQDFGAKVVCDNLNALAAWLAHDDRLAPTGDSYKVNRTLAFNTLKVQLGRWLLKALPTARKVASALNEIVKNLQQFRPGREQPRPSRHKPHKYHSIKPAV